MSLLFVIVTEMDLHGYQQQMDKAISFLKSELGGIQVGRAAPGLLDSVSVQASYGTMKVPQIAHVAVLDAQTLKVEPWDKGEVKNIEKAIYDAELGLTPQSESGHVIIKIPPLTQERRQELVKKIKQLGEETKAQIRRVRQDALKETKNLYEDKEISEDQHKANEEQIDELVKKENAHIDDIIEHKSTDVMKV